MKRFLPFALLLGTFAAISTLPGPVSGQPQGKKKAPPTKVRTVTMATGLWHPWSLAFLPNGDMLVTERNGKQYVSIQCGSSLFTFGLR